MEPVIVNFGCGPYAPGGYVNVDGSLTVLLSRLPIPAALFGPKAGVVQAVRKGRARYVTARRAAYAAGSIDGFYASHVLEHMTRRDCLDLLTRVRRWLRPAGVLRIVLPDLQQFASQYVAGEIDGVHFVRRLGLAIDDARWWRIALGRDLHRWMYDAKTMREILESLGYANIRRCECGDSALEGLSSLDLAVNRAAESFYIEAFRS